MTKKILGWVILIVLLAYIAGVGIWTHAQAAKDICKGIDVQIVDGLSSDSVTLPGVMVEISKYPEKIVDSPVISVNTKKLETYLKTFPQFEDVKCNFTTNGILHVQVTPMIPTLRVFEGNESYYVNKDGKRMDSKASFFVDVPVVSGNFKDKIKPKDLLNLSRHISSDPILKGLVGMIYVEDHDNILLVPRIHGHVINFGDTSRFDEKREALLAMYRKVMPYKGWEEYDTISVKFRGQVVATRRDKTRRNNQNVVYEEDDMEEATLPEIENTETQNP